MHASRTFRRSPLALAVLAGLISISAEAAVNFTDNGDNLHITEYLSCSFDQLDHSFGEIGKTDIKVTGNLTVNDAMNGGLSNAETPEYNPDHISTLQLNGKNLHVNLDNLTADTFWGGVGLDIHTTQFETPVFTVNMTDNVVMEGVQSADTSGSVKFLDVNESTASITARNIHVKASVSEGTDAENLQIIDMVSAFKRAGLTLDAAEDILIEGNSHNNLYAVDTYGSHSVFNAGRHLTIRTDAGGEFSWGVFGASTGLTELNAGGDLTVESKASALSRSVYALNTRGELAVSATNGTASFTATGGGVSGDYDAQNPDRQWWGKVVAFRSEAEGTVDARAIELSAVGTAPVSASVIALDKTDGNWYRHDLSMKMTAADRIQLTADGAAAEAPYTFGLLARSQMEWAHYYDRDIPLDEILDNGPTAVLGDADKNRTVSMIAPETRIIANGKQNSYAIYSTNYAVDITGGKTELIAKNEDGLGTAVFAKGGAGSVSIRDTADNGLIQGDVKAVVGGQIDIAMKGAKILGRMDNHDYSEDVRGYRDAQAERLLMINLADIYQFDNAGEATGVATDMAGNVYREPSSFSDFDEYLAHYDTSSVIREGGPDAAVAGYAFEDPTNRNGTINLTLSEGSTWDVTGDSWVNALSLNDSTLNMTSDVRDTNYRTVRAETFEGKNNRIAMRVNLASENEQTLDLDQLVVGSAGEETANTVVLTIEGNAPAGKLHAVNPSVIYGGGAMMTFRTEGGEVDGQTYRWELRNAESASALDGADLNALSESAASNNWYLVRVAQESTPETSLLGSLGTGMSSYLTWRSELETLRDRLGEVRQGGTDGGWVKLDYEKSRASAAQGLSFKQQDVSLTAGADRRVVDNNGEKVLIGAAFKMGKADQEAGAEKSKGDLAHFSVKGYTTWTRENGAYVDAVVQAGLYKTDLEGSSNTGRNRAKAGYTTFGFGASLEVGHQFKFGANENGHWFAEPQAQLSVWHLKGADYTLSTGMKAVWDDTTFVTGRLGAVAGKTFTKGEQGTESFRRTQFGVRAGVNNDFKGTQTLRTGDIAQKVDATGTTFYYGLEANHQVGHTNFYVTLDRETGNKYRKDLGVKAGLRVSF